MQIDWVTVVAQLVNFGLLIWLLQKLLYSPIIKLIATREADIAERVDTADARARAAEDQFERLSADQKALEASRASVLEDAKKAGEEQARAVIDEAREKARQSQLTWQRDLDAQTAEMSHHLSREAACQIEKIAARCLRDLADEDLQHAMAKQLAKALEALPNRTKSNLRKTSARSAIKTVSRYPLAASTRKLLKSTLQAFFDEPIDIENRVDEALGPGLVLDLGAQKLDWTIDTYLSDFTQQVQDRLGGEHAELPSSGQQVVAS